MSALGFRGCTAEEGPRPAIGAGLRHGQSKVRTTEYTAKKARRARAFLSVYSVVYIARGAGNAFADDNRPGPGPAS